MIDLPVPIDIHGAEGFPSLAALREYHTMLAERRRAGESQELFALALAFMQRCVITGTQLDAIDDRRAAQNLLNYWSNVLYRAGYEPPDALLAEFDIERSPMLPEHFCPYVGLEAFREHDHARFFGRRELVEQALARLNEQRLVAIVGPSGSGKSSLALAGMLPALRVGALAGSDTWRYLPPITPGSEPRAALARVLDSSLAEMVPDRVDQIRANPELLAEWLGDTPTVLVVDQFEELFTLCENDSARQGFAACLLAIATAPTARHLVVLTMRSDFESFVVRLPELQPRFMAGRIQVTPLSATDLREAIEAPADVAGLKFESGVVDLLIHELLGEPAGLPLLQFSLLKLWDARDHNRVTRAAYDQSGGGRKALALAADTAYNALLPEDQPTARRMLLRLSRTADQSLEVTRGRVRIGSLLRNENPERVDRVLERLVAARLVRLTQGDRSEDDQAEVAHEALVRNWPRLAGWLEEQHALLTIRRRLESRASEWQRLGQGLSGLFDDGELREADRWLQDPDFTDLGYDQALADLIDASRAELDRQRMAVEAARRERESLLEAQAAAETAARIAAEGRAETERKRAEEREHSSRRLRRAAIALVITAAIAIVSAIAAVVFGLQARADRAIAQQAQVLAERIARVGSLAAQAQTIKLQYPQRSLLLAIQSLQLLHNGDPMVPAAEQALRDTLASIGGRPLRGHTGAIAAVALSSDGRTLVTGSKDGARVWDLTAADPNTSVRFLPGYIGSVNTLVLSSDGRTLITGDYDVIRVWDLTAADPNTSVRVLRGHDNSVNALVLSSDGRTLITGSYDKTVRVWDLAAADPNTSVRVLRGHDSSVNALALSSDGRTLVTGSGDKTVRVWDLTSADPNTSVRVLRGHDSSVNALALSNDGRTLVTGSYDKTARVWDLTSADPSANVRVLRSHDSSVNALALSNDGRTLVTGSGDKTARVWDLTSADPSANVRVLRGNDSSVNALALSSDGRTLVTGSDDKTARIWDLTTADPSANVRVLRGHNNNMNVLVLSRDGRTLVTGITDSAALVWALDLVQLASSACQQVGSNLSWTDWQLYFSDQPYQRTCPDLPVHPSVIAAAHDVAFAGNVDQAMVLFQQVLAFDPTIDLDPNTLMIDSDPQIVAKHIAAQGLIDKAGSQANDGTVDQVIVLLQQALTLNPTIDLDPNTPEIDHDPQIVAKHFAAQGLITKAGSQANDGTVDQVIVLFQQALALDPTIDLDPKTPVIDLDPQIVAKHIVAQGLIIKAVASGNDGRVDEAIDLFQQALTLDPTIDLDPITPTIDNNPQIVAQHIAAPALINKAVVLVNKGKIDEALANIAKVQQFDPIVPSSSYDNNSLCWFGSLWGAAERVMSFCEEGVRLAPEDAHIRDSRGLARALIEAKKGAKADYRGAIEDFNAYIAAGGSDEKIAQRKAWVAALSETPPRNPFDQQTLESLR